MVYSVVAISRCRPPPSLSAILVIPRCRPSSSATSNDWAQPRRSLGWSVCPLEHTIVVAQSRHLKPGKLQSPARRRSFPVLAHAIPRQTGASVPIVHVCIAALHGLQINCTTLKWLPAAGHNQTWPWACALFSSQKLLEIIVNVIW